MKYGINSVDLVSYHPNFFEDCRNHRILWQKADEDIRDRVQTFLIIIAKIKHRHFDCYFCVYPHATTADYTVFVDIDSGRECLLLSTIRDRNQFPKSGIRIKMLTEDLLLLDASKDLLLSLRQEMLYSQHPDGQSRR